MRQSEKRILTTHTGSLPRPLELTKLYAKRARGEPVDAATLPEIKLRAGAGFALDYFEVRHAGTLAPIASVNDGPIRILAAARIGTTRLIDNVAV